MMLEKLNIALYICLQLSLTIITAIPEVGVSSFRHINHEIQGMTNDRNFSQKSYPLVTRVILVC